MYFLFLIPLTSHLTSGNAFLSLFFASWTIRVAAVSPFPLPSLPLLLPGHRGPFFGVSRVILQRKALEQVSLLLPPSSPRCIRNQTLFPPLLHPINQSQPITANLYLINVPDSPSLSPSLARPLTQATPNTGLPDIPFLSMPAVCHSSCDPCLRRGARADAASYTSCLCQMVGIKHLNLGSTCVTLSCLHTIL